MAVFNSAILAAGATAIAVPLGTLLAVLIGRFELPGRRAAAVCLFGLLLLPLYVQLSAWDAALGKLGWYSLQSGQMAQPFLAGMRGAIFVHGVAAVPWVAAIVGLGLLGVRRAEEEAALLDLPPRGVLLRVTLPQVAPFLVAAALWTVVTTTSEMTVTNIYLVDPSEQTYTERFYMALALSGNVSQAAVAVLPAVVGLVALIAGSLWMASRLAPRPATMAVGPPMCFDAGTWQPVATAALGVALLLLVGIPVISLLAKAGFVVLSNGPTRSPSWSLGALAQQLGSAPWRFAREFTGTGVVATCAATLVLAISLPLAWRAGRSGRWAAFSGILVGLCLAIPGPLVGIGLIRLLNHDLPPAIPLAGGISKSWLLALYDETPLAPVLAQAIRAFPLTLLILWHSFATLDRDVLSAAALAGLHPRQVFWRIAVPQRWRQAAAAWLVAFAIAAGDLAWSHLVTPPGLDLLSRRVFGLVHSGVEEQVAAICLVVVLAYGGLAALTLWIVQSTTRRASKGSSIAAIPEFAYDSPPASAR